MLSDIQNKPRLEVADIFRRYLSDYQSSHNITTQQQKTLHALINCRTQALGGHIEKCSNVDCDYETNAYNSCRNRHCAKCNGSKRIKWVSERLKEILPIPYFHIIFTLPSVLRQFTLYNQAVIYDLFFKASSYTLNQFSKDKKYLGARMGFMGILHSWGQTLCYHPHLHYVVTGGGLVPDKSEWLRLPYQKKFIFPVRAMSKVMMGRFIRLFKEAYQNDILQFPGRLETISDPYSFNRFCNSLYNQNWYIYAKPPFSGPDTVIRYFSRYTHRVAISNNRLINIDNDSITFWYKDYKDNAKTKTLSLSADAFIKRFLWHILPRGFRKIRYYGILAPGLRVESLALVRDLISQAVHTINHHIQDYIDRYLLILEHHCPLCKTGRLVFYYNTA